jgi:hypothetical protein
LQAIWDRAKKKYRQDGDVNLLEPIKSFWDSNSPSIDQYLALEEHTVLAQMQRWSAHSDSVLSDLCCRFLQRDRFVGITAPLSEELLQGLAEDEVKKQLAKWERGLRRLARREGFKEPRYYVLRDMLEEKVYRTKGGPYLPEKETSEQTPDNAIWILPEGSNQPVEISDVLTRLKAVTEQPLPKVRFYVPHALKNAAQKILSNVP